jgi:hypothetical protein
MDPEELTVADPGGGELVVIQPGQKYIQTFPFGGVLTCVRCGALVDELLTAVHDQAHGD